MAADGHLLSQLQDLVDDDRVEIEVEMSRNGRDRAGIKHVIL